MSENLETDNGFGFAVAIAGDDRIGAREIQLDAGDGQRVDVAAVTFTLYELLRIAVIVRLEQKNNKNCNSNYSTISF